MIHRRKFLLGAIAASLLSAPLIPNAQTLELVGPLRMADSPLGLIVADYVGGQVVIVDPATMQVTDAVPIYTDDTMLERGKPLSVGWLNGRLYVGEERTGLIQVFRKTGGKKNTSNRNPRKQARWMKQARWIQVSSSLTAVPIGQPSAIVADEALGWLFIASKIDGVVYVLDDAGTVLRTIGGPDSLAPLGKPQAIALDPAGQRIFVSDDGFETCSWMGCSASSLVQVFDYSGQPLGSISGSGSSGLKFSRVQGVARDNDGRVFIADTFRNEILVFAESSPNSWSAIATLGTKGAAPGQLLLPTGVFSDTAGARLLVANTMLGRIEVFATEGLPQ